jgi:chorismate lyase/3-hydroxybenzoate synthase
MARTFSNPEPTTDFDDVMRSSSGEQPAQPLPATALRVAYHPLDRAHELPAGVLAAIRFGARLRPEIEAAASSQPAGLTIDVGLEPLHAANSAPTPGAELWFATGPIHTGQWSDDSGSAACQVRYAHDGHYLFAAVELDEREHGGILLTAERAYAAIRRFQQQSGFPHLLRMWNYMDAINEGTGDLERYRQFNVGRGRGLGEVSLSYPSATAIGKHHSDHILQVFWLAGTVAGQSLENPRQVSAYHYPRVHGPVSPVFARALIAPDDTLLISGTASIVGHHSQHHDDAMEQLEETIRNLSSFAPHVRRPRHANRGDLLKVYVRDPALTPRIAERLRQLYPTSDILFVAADVCRRELLLEIEAISLAPQGS